MISAPVDAVIPPGQARRNMRNWSAWKRVLAKIRELFSVTPDVRYHERSGVEALARFLE